MNWYDVVEELFAIDKQDDVKKVQHYKKLALELAIAIVDEEDDTSVICESVAKLVRLIKRLKKESK